VDPDQVRFAHQLTDGGVDLIHGHSSHHLRPVEEFRPDGLLAIRPEAA